METLLSVVQKHCERQNLDVPSTVMGSSDPMVTQIRALLEEEGDDLTRRHRWQRLIKEATWTTLAQVNQGAITSIAPNGFREIINDTMWDRATRLPVTGPISPQKLQQITALGLSSPRYNYHIRGGWLMITPAPPAGDTWAFMYVSSNWILNNSQDTWRSAFVADTDYIALPDRLCLMGLRWRWKKEKGFDYAEDFRTYEMMVKKEMAADGGKPVLSMDMDASERARPGIFISPGSVI